MAPIPGNADHERFVAFVSAADNLVTGDGNGRTDGSLPGREAGARILYGGVHQALFGTSTLSCSSRFRMETRVRRAEPGSLIAPKGENVLPGTSGSHGFRYTMAIRAAWDRRFGGWHPPRYGEAVAAETLRD
jgi:hypothetical protein